MAFSITVNDITKMQVDAIVNSADASLMPAGGVSRAIFTAAASDLLLTECKNYGTCNTGTAVITNGYNLKARYIIHTVAPMYQPGNTMCEKLLYACYKTSLMLALENGANSIAFPLLGTGKSGWPGETASLIARRAITDFIKTCEINVYLVIFDRNTFKIDSSLFSDINNFLSRSQVLAPPKSGASSINKVRTPLVPQRKTATAVLSSLKTLSLILSKKQANFEEPSSAPHKNAPKFCSLCGQPVKRPDSRFCSNCGRPFFETEESVEYLYESRASNAQNKSRSLKLTDVLRRKDPLYFEKNYKTMTFSEMLLKTITDRNLKDSDVYNRANIDRKLFSKIRSNRDYHPKKNTVLAFAIALELDLKQTNALLASAGYVLSSSFVTDIIIEYFIKHKNYDIFEINEALFAFDQPVLAG